MTLYFIEEKPLAKDEFGLNVLWRKSRHPDRTLVVHEDPKLAKIDREILRNAYDGIKIFRVVAVTLTEKRIVCLEN